MVRCIALSILFAACTHSSSRASTLPESSAIEAGWTENARALVIYIHDPYRYLTVLNAYPFSLRVTMLERSDLVWQHADRWRPIAEGTTGEMLWEHPLRLLTFINVDRFLSEGRIALRPVGHTVVENPLRDRCPLDLVHVGTADLDGGNIRVHDVVTAGRDDRYGCLYRAIVREEP